MIIRFNRIRALYVNRTDGRENYATFTVYDNEDVEVELIDRSDRLVDIRFLSTGYVATGCERDWYNIIENGQIKKLAYVSKMDRLPLP